MMPIRPIRTDEDHETALREIEALWGAEESTDAGDQLHVLATLVETYESRRWPCLLYTSPSPRDRQKSRMPSSA